MFCFVMFLPVLPIDFFRFRRELPPKNLTPPPQLADLRQGVQRCDLPLPNNAPSNVAAPSSWR
jgi:hypothetical protein